MIRAITVISWSVALVAILLLPCAEAQPLWTDPEDQRLLHVEVLKPFLDGEGDRILNTAVLLGGRQQIGKRFHLVIQVPFVRADLGPERREPVGWVFLRDSTGFAVDSVAVFGRVGGSEFFLGNTYVGLEMQWQKDSRVSSHFGMRITGIDSNRKLGQTVGVLSDLQHREAFLSGYFAWQVAVQYKDHLTDRWWLRVTGGPRYGTFVDGGGWELWFVWTGALRHERDTWRVTAGWTGRTAPMAEYGPRDRFQNQLWLEADRSTGVLRPGAGLAVWLDKESRDVMPLLVRIRLAWSP